MPPPLQIVIGTVAQSVSSWTLFVGMDLSLFVDAGVAVELRTMHNSAAHVEALLQGRIDVGDQLADHIIRAVAGGADLVAFLGVDRPDTHLIVESGVQTFDGLRGRGIAVDGLQTGYALVLRRMLTIHDLDPTGDVVLQPLGGTHQRFQSLIEGQVAGTLLDPPYRLAAVARGMRSLARTSDVAPGYQGTVQACSRAWAENHESELTNYVRGYAMAWDWLHDPTNREAATDLIARRLGLDGAIAAETYQVQVIGKRFNPRGALQPEDLGPVLGLMSEAGQGADPSILDRSCDRSFLERAGVFD